MITGIYIYIYTFLEKGYRLNKVIGICNGNL
jgi:hypothetical protein